MLDLKTQRGDDDTLTAEYAEALGRWMPSQNHEVPALTKVMHKAGGFFLSDCRTTDLLKWHAAIEEHNEEASKHEVGKGWTTCFEKTMGPIFGEKHVFPGPTSLLQLVERPAAEKHEERLASIGNYVTTATLIEASGVEQYIKALKQGILAKVVGYDPARPLSVGPAGQLARIMYNFSRWFLRASGVVQQAKSGNLVSSLWTSGLSVIEAMFPVVPKSFDTFLKIEVDQPAYRYYATVARTRMRNIRGTAGQSKYSLIYYSTADYNSTAIQGLLAAGMKNIMLDTGLSDVLSIAAPIAAAAEEQAAAEQQATPTAGTGACNPLASARTQFGGISSSRLNEQFQLRHAVQLQVRPPAGQSPAAVATAVGDEAVPLEPPDAEAAEFAKKAARAEQRRLRAKEAKERKAASEAAKAASEAASELASEPPAKKTKKGTACPNPLVNPLASLNAMDYDESELSKTHSEVEGDLNVGDLLGAHFKTDSSAGNWYLGTVTEVKVHSRPTDGSLQWADANFFDGSSWIPINPLQRGMTWAKLQVK